MAITSFKRYERKFLITDEQAAELLPYIENEMRVDAYCTNGRFYYVYNIYYDTNHDDVIRESCDKPYYKEKMRIRTYSLEDENAPVFLELKKKIDRIVTKRRIVMTRKQYKTFLADNTLPDTTDRQITNELRYYLSVNDVHPNVYLSYERRAFFGKEDSEFRLTMDKNIRARRCDLEFEKGNGGELLLPEGKCLMEIKFENCLPFWLARRLSEMKIFPSSFSKYGTEYKIKCLGARQTKAAIK